MQPRSRKKFGWGSLSFSVVFHTLLILIGAIWAIKILPPEPEKKVDFMAKSGGGGTPDAHKMSRSMPVPVTPPDLARIAAVGAASSITLPEPDGMTQMASLTSLSAGGGLSQGLGGTGSGGGRGTGNGAGIGSGSGLGLSDGGGLKSPFGLASSTAVGLSGKFYDFKRNPNGTPKESIEGRRGKPASYQEIIGDFTKGMVWGAPRSMKPFVSPTELVAKVFAFKGIADTEVGKAFDSPETKPGMWVAHYAGDAKFVGASGRYRLVGWGDNCMIVGINGKVALDASDRGYTGKKREALGAINVEGKPSALVFRGDWIELRNGQSVRIDVLLSDEGGIFSGAAFLESQSGPEYKGGEIPKLQPLMVASLSEADSAWYKFLPAECFQDAPMFDAKRSAF